jgi:UDP-N-acetylmuramate-alanine ligase
VDVNNISNFLNKSKKEAYGVSNCEEALSKLVNVVKKDDLVVFMSSGDMDKIPTRFSNI